MIRPGSLSTEMDTVTLRRLTPDDAAVYFDAIESNRDHLSQFGEPTASSRPDLETVKKQIETTDPARTWQLGIWNDEDFVGSINLSRAGRSATLGYWLAAEHQHKGYATVATLTIAEFASREFYHVDAMVRPENEPSLRVLARSGFSNVATIYSDMGRFKHLRFTDRS